MSDKKQHPLDKKSGAGGVNVRSSTIKKLAKDGISWTPTEKLRRDRMLQQFCKKGRKGVGYSGATPEYLEGYDGIDWSKG